MRRPVTTILLLVLMAFQAVVGGGLRGPVAICLGGGHEHDVEDVAVGCEAECGHASQLPVAVLDDGHDERCACTDVELSLVDILAALRDAHGSAPTIPPVSFAGWIVTDHAASLCWRGPPVAAYEDFGEAQRLSLVRSTRLII